MKLLNKIIKVLLVIVMLFTASIGKAGTQVKAATLPVTNANLYSKGAYGNMLRYNGVEVLTTYVVYQKDGTEYPAYCIDPGIDGVGERGSYNVNVESLLNDVMLWRVIVNGYPYKSISQLGCNTKEEAYCATKQAVYSMIFGREASWYDTIGEQGVRVRNAMAQILSNARASTQGKPSSNIEIIPKQSEWKIDTTWNNYISQTFEISASTAYSTYNVKLEGDYPEEAKVVSENNQIKSTFSTGEKFKIAIPLKNLKQTGDFKVTVTTKLNTKPVFYGKAPSSDLQDYALTASSYEDASGIKSISYFKNETQIEVLKQDGESLKPISDVEFRILDSNKNPVYTNLITNEEGKIELTNLLPGKYYLEEVKAKEGYLKYEGQIEFDLELNQTLTIKVNNSLEKKTEYVSNTQDITVNQSKQEIVVKDNKEVSTKNENKVVVDTTHNYENINDNINVQESTHNQSFNNQNSNINLDKLTNNTNISNKNENINMNEQSQNTNIQNVNVNTNKNVQNTNTNIQNENINTNVNTQNKNVNTNINTQNQNINISNQNNNTIISSLNGIVKLPKTGM